MKNYTWIEIPTLVLNYEQNALTRKDFTLIAHICSKADGQGFISEDDHAWAMLKSSDWYNDDDDLWATLPRFETIKLMFHGPKSSGQYVNFADNKQSLALFNERSFDEDDSIRRIPFPLELSLDKRLNMYDLKFLSLCFTYANQERTFVESSMILGFTQFFNLEVESVRSTVYRLEALGYMKISYDPAVLFLLP